MKYYGDLTFDEGMLVSQNLAEMTFSTFLNHLFDIRYLYELFEPFKPHFIHYTNGVHRGKNTTYY